MPIIDAFISAGQFDPSQQDQLAKQLSQTLLNCDVTRDNPKAPAINWCYIHEQAAGSIYVAGQPQHKPHYRIAITIMQGAMSEAVKQQVVQDMTQVILAVEGTSFNPMNAARIWITIHEIEEGNWAGAGQIYRLNDLKDYLSRE
ncbi:MAG: tautomerase family protein [Gammaproteobacteria bacterium]